MELPENCKVHLAYVKEFQAGVIATNASEPELLFAKEDGSWALASFDDRFKPTLDMVQPGLFSFLEMSTIIHYIINLIIF